MRAVIFFSIIAALLGYTIFKAQQLLPNHRFLASMIALALFVVMLLWQFLYRYNTGLVYTTGYSIAALVGAFIMGLWASFLILALLGDIVHLVLLAIDHFTEPKMLNPERRRILTQWVPLGILGLSAGMTAIGSTKGLTGPDVKTVDVPIKDLPPDLEGFSIAQISDLHVGPNIGQEYSENVVRLTNALNADMIAVTGDLVDGVPEILHRGVAPLAQFKAKHGVFYVTGNHEYYWGVDRWLAKCKELNFIPLMNEHRLIQVGASSLLVGGVPDTQGARFKPSHAQDFSRAAGANADVKVLLSHRPDVYAEAQRHGFHLVLAGHTHAGQFFPWSVFVSLAYKYYRGLNRFEDLWVYVNAGTGYWGPMNRFTVPSEITLIRLKRA